MSFLDFLHPLWKKSLTTNDQRNRETRLNTLVLSSIDQELNNAKEDTISAKAQSFLGRATDEWLDYWGSWFGLARTEGQTDDEYRQAIINHVKHARNTIPALRESIAKFLQTSVDNVHIYEPWNDVLITNDNYTALNSRALLLGDYARAAIIDIQISVPFPPEIIDVINWFRPAGVVYRLTSTYGMGANAPVWNAPTVYTRLLARLTTIKQMTGLTKHLSASLSPAKQTLLFGDQNIFILNDSDLNSKSLILAKGVPLRLSDYYSFAGTSYGMIMPKANATLDEVAKTIEVLPPQQAENLGNNDGNTVTLPVSRNLPTDNLLSDTYDWENWTGTMGNTDKATRLTNGAFAFRFGQEFASVQSDQQPDLENNQQYTLSFYAWSKNIVGNGKLKLYGTLDSTHKDILLTDQISNHITQYHMNFTYTDSFQLPVQFVIKGDFSYENEVYLAGVKLEKGINDNPQYTRGQLDYNTPQTSEFHYTYGLFDFDNFFFQNVESQALLINKLGTDYSMRDAHDYMLNELSAFDFVTHYKAEGSTNNVHSQLMFYNFHLGLWVRYQDDNLIDHNVDMNIPLKNFGEYISDKGLIAVGIQTETMPDDYNLVFDDLSLSLDTITEGKDTYSINVYDQGGDVSTAMVLQHFHLMDHSGQVDSDELYDRYEDGYPIRYIRNTIKDLHFIGDGSTNPRPFTTNLSHTNDTDYLSDWQRIAPSAGKVDTYSNFTVLPKHNPIDNRLPVASISLLGAYASDKVNKNFLGNLLPKGVFSNQLMNDWRLTANEGMPQNKSQSDTIFGYHLEADSTNQNEQELHIFSENTYKESSYKFTFSARAYEQRVKAKVTVYLYANGLRTQALSQDYLVGFTPMQGEVKFDTNTIFADRIEIVVSFADNQVVNVDFGNTDLRLNALVYVDGLYQDRQSPELVPARYALNFTDPDIDRVIDKSDLDGKVTYDDIQFDNQSDPMYWDDGLRQTLYYKGNEDKPWNFVGFSTQYLVRFTDYLKAVHPEIPVEDRTKAFEDNYQEFLNYAGQLQDKDKLNYQQTQNVLTYVDTLRQQLSDLDVDDNIAHDFAQVDEDFVTYLNTLGFKAHRKVHTVTLDLGRVYTNIQSLYVQHGSDSDASAEYDSCLETSVDGIHWTTWYDNFLGHKETQDPYYLENMGRPREFKLPKYNKLGYALDDDHEADMGQKWASMVSERYPAYNTRQRLLGEDSDLDKVFLVSDYLEKNLGGNGGQVISNTVDSPYDYMKHNPSFNWLGTTTTTLPLPSDIFSTTTTSQYQTTLPEYTTISTTYTLKPTTTTTTTAQGTTTTSTTTIGGQISTTTQNPVETKTTTITDYSKWFVIQKSKLNGKDLIADVWSVVSQEKPPVKPDDPGTIPAHYTIAQQYMTFDIVSMVSKKYPYLYQTLGLTTRKEQAAFIQRYLVGKVSGATDLALDVTINSTRAWRLSVWQKDQYWSKGISSSLTGISRVLFSISDIATSMTSDGYVFALAYATMQENTAFPMTTKVSTATLQIHPKLLDTFAGGLYPHDNMAQKTHQPVDMYGNNLVLQTAKLYELDKQVLGHKVRVSFNVLSDTNIGQLTLTSPNMVFAPQELKNIHRHNQHYSFVVDIPEASNGNPVLSLSLANGYGHLAIFGFKAEIGADESPYQVARQEWIDSLVNV